MVYKLSCSKEYYTAWRSRVQEGRRPPIPKPESCASKAKWQSVSNARDIVVELAALNSTAVSRVISPASSAQVLGHAPKIMIPKYPCAMPVGDIPRATDCVWSETERSLPQSVASLVLNTNRWLFFSATRINSVRQISWISWMNQPDQMGKHRGTRNKQSIRDIIIIHL